VVLCIGYPRSNVAKADAKALAAALQAQVTSPVQWYVVDSKMDSPAVQAAIANATGILLTAPDQSLVLDALGSQPAITSAIQNGWAGGRTLLADNAAAAALAQAVSVDPPPTSASLEDDSMGDFLLGGVTLHPGLNWLPGVVVEPRMVMDRHWGRAYSQLYHAPSLLALGVDVDTAIEFTASGALVWGRNTVTVLDGRFASYGVGSNGALSERYVLMDTYVEGDGISP
jgi:cyanophycinase-like exopeptidase